MKSDLQDTFLQDTFLQDTFLQDTFLHGADLQDANLQDANLQGAFLKGAKNLTPEQVKKAKNWESAHYDPEFRAKLDPPPGEPETKK